jgi:P27 family predicted phage terminase small subunit
LLSGANHWPFGRFSGRVATGIRKSRLKPLFLNGLRGSMVNNAWRLAPGRETQEQNEMSPPGRRPLPTHLKVLRGNPGRRALPENEPEPAAPLQVPDAPAFLQGYACDEWYRIAEELLRLGLLTVVDLQPLAAYCMSYARWRTAEETLIEMAKLDPVLRGLLLKTRSGTPIQNPLVATAARAAADMVRYATEFGLTPSARARISAGPLATARDSKFAGLLAS